MYSFYNDVYFFLNCLIAIFIFVFIMIFWNSKTANIFNFNIFSDRTVNLVSTLAVKNVKIPSTFLYRYSGKTLWKNGNFYAKFLIWMYTQKQMTTVLKMFIKFLY